MRYVPLNKGKFAMVDDSDFDKVSQFNWFYQITHHGKGNEYAYRHVRKESGQRTTELMHRFVCPHLRPCDHIDGNGLNNQKANLRKCNRTQNAQNARIRPHSTPYKGVHFFKAGGNYQARLTVNKKDIFLGYFRDAISAAKAYDAAALKHFGEYARTNQQIGVL